ncbi:hypothetical protein [Hyphobacterium sp.]|uniref:hypothetical protein n=1 Tax=Hyphobacterium sp. TaxID=2004662 RepID=UPI0037484FEC
MTEATYSDRRNATSPEQHIMLESGRISVSMDGKLQRAIAFDEINEVRLGVEMAGRDSQVVCRITANDRTRIVFGSRSWKSVGLWENQADRFREFNTALHRALLPHAAGIRFMEGQPLWFGFVMCGLGLLMALLGGGFALYLLWDDNLIGFGGVPGLIIGLYLAWMFRPRAPKPYDPALYAGTG